MTERPTHRGTGPGRARRAAAILLLGCLTAGHVAAWTPEDGVATACLPVAVASPDGERVAYVVERANLEAQPGGWRATLHVATADGASRRRYTPPAHRLSDPEWSPDGAWIAYLETALDGVTRLMAVPLDGGAPRPLLDGSGDGRLVAFRWSPRGDAIALLRADPGAADTGDAAAVTADPSPPARHLWRLPVLDGAPAGPPTRITGGAFSVGSDLLANAFDWSPDGRHIAFTRVRSAAPADWTSADVALVDVASGAVRAFQQSNAAEFSPRFSPDGARLAFAITAYPPSWIRQVRVGVARLDGSGLRLLAATPDQQPRLIGWMSDRLLLVSEHHRAATALWTLPVDGGDPRRFDSGDRALAGVTLNGPGTRLAMVTSGRRAAPEAAVTATRRFRPETVSRANARSVPPPDAGTRLVSWQSDDGQDIEGLLTLPPGHRDGDRQPLVLMIHGGPAGAFTDSFPGGFDGLPPVAALSGAGYAVLRANPRGSSGYGYGFRAALRGDWGGADAADLLAGVDAMIDLGIADPQRLGVVGWSYGGYQTAWLIANHHRFAAAAAIAPFTDLATLSATTDLPGAVEDWLGGPLWDRPDLYRERSPLWRADAITTPLLLLHGTDDTRVPPGQSVALHRALARRGLDSRLVRFPRAGHLIDEPAQSLRLTREILAWFDRFL